MSPSWSPVLSPARAEVVLDVVQQIVRDVSVSDPVGEAAGDLALLLAHAGQASLVVDEALAARSLDRCVQTANLRPGLWGGASGVAFRVAQLADGEEADQVCRVLHERVEQTLAGWQGTYDLIGGLVGFGVAALERLDRPDGSALAACVLDRLEATAREEAEGVAWFTPPELLPDWQRALCPEGYYNLGLAHGIPGVIGLLSRYVRLGFERERALRLLERALSWLLARSSDEGFPQWLAPGLQTRSGRLAWCYGDLGVAVSLLGAALATGDEGLRAFAIALAHRVMDTPRDLDGVQDAGLCHGAAGVAHLFGRMYRATGDERLGQAAVAWIDRVLAMRDLSLGISGFPAIDHDPERGWYPKPALDLLTGATGVALALLAAATDVEPAWDRALLVDLPPSWEGA